MKIKLNVIVFKVAVYTTKTALQNQQIRWVENTQQMYRQTLSIRQKKEQIPATGALSLQALFTITTYNIRIGQFGNH